jgi:DNA-binding Lrp family transcriptional regulator
MHRESRAWRNSGITLARIAWGRHFGATAPFPNDHWHNPGVVVPGRETRYHRVQDPPARPPPAHRKTDRSPRRMKAIFVQIKCEMGQAYRVAREAADTIPQLSELFSTSGQYDLLGKFYLEPEQDIGLFVTEQVQSLPGVKDTYTLITFNAFGGGRGGV